MHDFYELTEEEKMINSYNRSMRANRTSSGEVNFSRVLLDLFRNQSHNRNEAQTEEIIDKIIKYIPQLEIVRKDVLNELKKERMEIAFKNVKSVVRTIKSTTLDSLIELSKFYEMPPFDDISSLVNILNDFSSVESTEKAIKLMHISLRYDELLGSNLTKTLKEHCR